MRDSSSHVTTWSEITHLAPSFAMWRCVAFRRLPGKAVNASASARRYTHNVMIGDNIDTALETM